MPTLTQTTSAQPRTRIVRLAIAAAITVPLSCLAGCSGEPSGGMEIPDMSQVPPPSQEPGDVPDPAKLKRVPLD